MKVILRALIVFLLLLRWSASATPEVERFLANPRFKRAEIAFEGTDRTFTGGLEDFGFYFISRTGGTNAPFIAGLNRDTAWFVAGDLGVVTTTNEFGATDPIAKAYIDTFLSYQSIWCRSLTNIATLFMTAAQPGTVRVDGGQFTAVNRDTGKPFTGTVLRDGDRISGFSYSANGFTNLLKFEYDPGSAVALPKRIRFEFGGAGSGSASVLVTKWDLSESDPATGFLPSSVLPELKLAHFAVVTNGITLRLNQHGEFEPIWMNLPQNRWKTIGGVCFAVAAFLAAIWFCRPGKRKNQ